MTDRAIEIDKRLPYFVCLAGGQEIKKDSLFEVAMVLGCQ